MNEPEWMVKKREYEQRMARVKNAKLRTLCTICSAKAKLPCPCGTAQYCSVACQKVDWRERGHKKVCKEIRARAEAPTPPPSPPKPVFYGPAPRSHADEIRARIAAEHEAARARREANPEREAASARYGSRCPVCKEDWDVNDRPTLRECCCQKVCPSCDSKTRGGPCPLCRAPAPVSYGHALKMLRGHVENDVPEALNSLGLAYRGGALDLVKSGKKAVKLFKRAVELGDVEAMMNLGNQYEWGDGVKQNTIKAIQLYRMASDRGDARAQCFLGCILREMGDYEEAVKFFRLSADQGFADSEYDLACCYAHGQGLDVDLDEAERLMRRAAAKRNPAALGALGRMHEGCPPT